VPYQQNQQAMADLFAQHMDAELAGDLETTLATMTDNPHLVNVPSMVGGAGREEVRAFYADHLVGKFFPPDVEFTEVSRTFGDRRLVDEHIHWDQATVLVQLGLLDPAGLPVAGREAAAKVLNPAIPGPHL
jgi:carboxymethylenebutenolidase